MVRLMLVLAPIMCILSGIGISAVLTTYLKNLESFKLDKKLKKYDDHYPKKSEVNKFYILQILCFKYLMSIQF